MDKLGRVLELAGVLTHSGHPAGVLEPLRGNFPMGRSNRANSTFVSGKSLLLTHLRPILGHPFISTCRVQHSPRKFPEHQVTICFPPLQNDLAMLHRT
jgi:hypothetical protein